MLITANAYNRFAKVLIGQEHGRGVQGLAARKQRHRGNLALYVVRGSVTSGSCGQLYSNEVLLESEESCATTWDSSTSEVQVQGIL